MNDRITPDDPAYFASSRDASRMEYGIRWPEHVHAGETVVEHVQIVTTEDAARRCARTGLNRDGTEYPPHGVPVVRRVTVEPWEEI